MARKNVIEWEMAGIGFFFFIYSVFVAVGFSKGIFSKFDGIV